MRLKAENGAGIGRRTCGMAQASLAWRVWHQRGIGAYQAARWRRAGVALGSWRLAWRRGGCGGGGRRAGTAKRWHQRRRQRGGGVKLHLYQKSMK